MFNRKKVLIVEPSALDRQELKTAIETHETLVDVMGAENIEQAVEKMRSYRPNVIFIDLPDPPQASLAFIASIKEADADTRVAVMSRINPVAAETLALENGADAFIAKGHGISLALIDLIHEMIRK